MVHKYYKPINDERSNMFTDNNITIIMFWFVQNYCMIKYWKIILHVEKTLKISSSSIHQFLNQFYFLERLHDFIGNFQGNKTQFNNSNDMSYLLFNIFFGTFFCIHIFIYNLTPHLFKPVCVIPIARAFYNFFLNIKYVTNST